MSTEREKALEEALREAEKTITLALAPKVPKWKREMWLHSLLGTLRVLLTATEGGKP